MKLLIVASLFAFALVAPVAPASTAGKLYVAQATAVIDISAEGHVEDVKLTGVPGDAARDAYRQQMLAWRFKPILVDGVAVPARAHAELRLVAQETEDGAFTLSMRDPVFIDPPGSDAPSPGGGLRLLERRVPRYPDQSAANGIEADIMLLIEIAADGSVRRAGVDRATLLGNHGNTRFAGSAVRPMVEAARRSVLRWRFEPSEKAVRNALVPIKFSMWGSEDVWRLARPVHDAREEWVSEYYAAKQDPEVEEFQPGRSTRFALLNPPEQPWL